MSSERFKTTTYETAREIRHMYSLLLIMWGSCFERGAQIIEKHGRSKTYILLLGDLNPLLTTS